MLYHCVFNALDVTGHAHSVLESELEPLPPPVRVVLRHIYLTCEIIKEDEGECVTKRRLYLKMDVLHHSVLLDVVISPFQGSTRGKKGVKSVTFLLVECFLGCQGSRSHLDLFSLKDVAHTQEKSALSQ